MRVVLDTNVLISALLVEHSRPATLVDLWRDGRFILLTAQPQLEELMRVSRYPKIRERLRPALAGRLINEMRNLAVLVTELPHVAVSPDPFDDYLLALADHGHADYLVTGDKSGLLALERYSGARIVHVSDFLRLTGY
jgi:putative PIN family toxin of toxin-antitoxin system